MKKLKNTNIKLLRILFWMIILYAFIWLFDINKTFQILIIVAILSVIEIIRFVSAKFLANIITKRWWKNYANYCYLKYHKHKIFRDYIIIAFRFKDNENEFAVFVWNNDEAGKYRLDWYKEYMCTGWINPRNKKEIKVYLDGWDLDTIKEALKKIKSWFEDLDFGYRLRNIWDNFGDFKYTLIWVGVAAIYTFIYILFLYPDVAKLAETESFPLLLAFFLSFFLNPIGFAIFSPAIVYIIKKIRGN